MTGLLSDTDIATALETGRLTITPLDPQRIQPASIDLTLSAEFLVFAPHGETHVDPENPPPGITSRVTVTKDDPFILHPGQFALGSTVEFVGLDDTIAARIEGRSTTGRSGLSVHTTAGFIDAGFRGHVTLELSNQLTLPLVLRPGLSCAQLCVVPLSSPVTRGYGDPELGSKYQHQQGPTAARPTLSDRSTS